VLIFAIIVMTVLFVLLTISVVLYFIQDSFIFHAEKLPLDYEFSFKNEFKEINLDAGDGNTLNAVLFKANNSKGILIYFHNHSGNIEHCSNMPIDFILNKNYDILKMDYRGYGKSTGKYNEELMLSDSLLWYDFVRKNYAEDLITVYGRGIGATFATYVSSRNNPNQLVLESPLFDLFTTASFLYPYVRIKKIISNYKFETAAYIVKVKCKIYIFHGVKDRLVHYSNGQRLYELVKDKSELFLIPEGNHYNLINDNTYLDEINKILE